MQFRKCKYSYLLLCTFIFMFVLMVSSCASGSNGGNVSVRHSVYRIYDVDDLFEFANRVNSGESSLNAVLMNDIDLRDKKTDALIGATCEQSYSGVFDGRGFTIRGLNISVVVPTGRQPDTSLFYSTSKALFGYIHNAEIKNLNVSGKVHCHGYQFDCAGIVGDSARSRIINCQFDGIVKNSSDNGHISGICAFAADSVIEQCTNKASVVSSVMGNTAGIVAFARDSLIDKCVNDAAVTYIGEISGDMGESIGGIGGEIRDSTIRECVNNGTVNRTGYSTLAHVVGIGGIVGSVDMDKAYKKSLVINSTNKADVTGHDHVGGIAGVIQTKNKVEQCKNYGHIVVTMKAPSTENPAFYGDIYGYCKEEDNTPYYDGPYDVEDPYDR